MANSINNKAYLQKLLTGWELTYKKGHLTFWILLSLKDGSKYVDDILNFIDEHSAGSISYDEQSLYRALRKYHTIELIDLELRDGNKGPSRKYYSLTKIGRELLEIFVERNILIFQSEKMLSLLKH
jgi:PadR family transcriptional regulator, regulatory protein PadR